MKTTRHRDPSITSPVAFDLIDDETFEWDDIRVLGYTKKAACLIPYDSHIALIVVIPKGNLF